MGHMTREQVDTAIAARIAADPAFLTWLLSDPHSALGELIGMDLPDEITITIHEETPTNIHLVVPSDAEQISEEDLSLVSGGSWHPDFRSDPTPPCASCG